MLYHARLHPEQYSDTFSDAQLKQLRESILHVCQTAVDLLADSSKFPEEWLFNHRWGKGKKDAPKSLPNGEKITFLTVGGRTSCVVPSVQKKTGAVAGDLKKEKVEELENDEAEPTKKPARGQGKAKKVKEVPEDDGIKTETEAVEKSNGKTSRKRKEPTKAEEPDGEISESPGREKKRQAGKAKPLVKSEDPGNGRRRSGRATSGKVNYNDDDDE